MRRTWLSRGWCCALVLSNVFAAGVGLAAAPDGDPASYLPDRIVRQMGESAPAWKSLWDEARVLADRGQDAEAVRRYDSLLAQRRNLSAARWEYAGILLRMGKDEQAAVQLETLLADHPEQTEVAREAGLVALRLSRFARAAEILARILPGASGDPDVLRGLVEALLALGQRGKALVHLEALARSAPETQAFRDLVVAACADGQTQRARPFLTLLADQPAADPAIVQLAAEVHEKAALPDQALRYWTLVHRHDPTNEPANRFLARHYEETGPPSVALRHLQALLAARPDDPRLHLKIGRFLAESGDRDAALSHFERYLAQVPEDREILRTVARLQAARGRAGESLAALERYFAVEEAPDPEILRRAAELYDERGDLAAALRIIRRLQALSPDDPALLRDLATHLQATGADREALAAWTRLAGLLPSDPAIQRTRVQLMDRLGETAELRPALEAIHRLDPHDAGVVLRLAGLAHAAGEAEALAVWLGELERLGQQGGEPVDWHIDLLLRQGRWAEAEQALTRRIREGGGGRERLLVLIDLAGRLGHPALAVWAAAQLGDDQGGRERLFVARALIAAGGLEEAESVLAWFGVQGGDIGQCQEALLLAARIARERGLLFEEEQILRRGLALDKGTPGPFLVRLVRAAVRGRAFDEAEAWMKWDGWTSRERLAASAILDAAQDRGRPLRQALEELAAGPTDPDRAPSMAGGWYRPADWGPESPEEIVLHFLLARGETTLASGLARSLASRLPGRTDAQLAVGLTATGSAGGDPARPEGEPDAARLLEEARFHRELARPEPMLAAARGAVALDPSSVAGRRLLAEALASTGQDAQSAEVLSGLVTERPGSQDLRARLAAIAFRQGRTAEVERLLSSPEAGDALPALRLLAARNLWLQDRRDEALALYREFLAEPVDDRLLATSQRLGVEVAHSKRRKSFRQWLHAAPYYDAALADAVYAPEWMAAGTGEAERTLQREAAELYAAYRWQRLFSLEYQARVAMSRDESLRAAELLERLAHEFPEHDIHLYDLAGVYGQLGRLREEALLYEELGRRAATYPGLDEARTRNEAKRRPKFVASYGYLRHEGRDESISMARDWAGLDAWYSPLPQHEVRVGLAKTNYQSIARTDAVRSQRAMASYSMQALTGLNLEMGAGLESLNHGNAANALFRLGGTGRLNDAVRATASFTRDLVADTTASLRREIIVHDLDTGLELEILPRLAVSGHYLAADYSDNNWTTGYSLGTSYNLLLREATSLRFSYGYTFKESKEGTEAPGAILEDGFSSDDHPYWAPKNYWLNRFGALLQHDLEHTTAPERGPRRQVSVGYFFGHDSGGYAFQQGEARLTFELAPRWEIEGRAEIFNSTPYRKKEIGLSASYRW